MDVDDRVKMCVEVLKSLKERLEQEKIISRAGNPMANDTLIIAAAILTAPSVNK